MAASSIASQIGIIASPVSVAVVSLTAFLMSGNNKLEGFDGYLDLLSITIPASMMGVLAIGIFSWFRGKDLDKDEVFQKYISVPENREYVYGNSTTLLGKTLPKESWIAMWIFFGAIIVVALLGAFDNLRPAWMVKDKLVRLNMVNAIQIFMLLAGALMVIFTKMDASKIGKNEVFRSGMIALVAVFGISWMADSMFEVHTPMIKDLLGGVVQQYPWTYALMLLIISKFVNSQAAAIAAFVPLALGIGVPPGIVVAFAPAAYGYYILPTYPSDLAALQFDRSGTTHIGKYVINHSFIAPGLIGVTTACIFGYIFASMRGFV